MLQQPPPQVNIPASAASSTPLAVFAVPVLSGKLPSPPLAAGIGAARSFPSPLTELSLPVPSTTTILRLRNQQLTATSEETMLEAGLLDVVKAGYVTTKVGDLFMNGFELKSSGEVVDSALIEKERHGMPLEGAPDVMSLGEDEGMLLEGDEVVVIIDRDKAAEIPNEAENLAATKNQEDSVTLERDEHTMLLDASDSILLSGHDGSPVLVAVDEARGYWETLRLWSWKNAWMPTSNNHFLPRNLGFQWVDKSGNVPYGWFLLSYASGSLI
ncbi:hypothetical protein PSPO01_03990 [Paraphaeosphaeria sporulosa]